MNSELAKLTKEQIEEYRRVHRNHNLRPSEIETAYNKLHDAICDMALAALSGEGFVCVPAHRIPRLIELVNAACRKAETDCDERSYELWTQVRKELSRREK